MQLFSDPPASVPGLALARLGVEAVIARAGELGLAMSIVVVDAQGHEVLASRMDGAPWFTLGVARSKARSSAALSGDSEELHEFTSMVGPDITHQIDHQLAFPLITVPGGVVVRRGRDIVAAVGVSGGPSELDADCARAGAAAMSS